MQRRSFLKHLAASPAAAANLLASSSLLTLARNSYAASGKTLVVIFQRGGCDGLNTVVPFGEDEYYALRPDIAIPPPNSGQQSAINLDGFFGLHPKLAPLNEIYQQGRMAVLPAVHYPNGSRSHFSSQDYIESGTSYSRLDAGWLNRHISSLKQNAKFRAISLDGLNHSLRGKEIVTTLSDLANAKDKGIDSALIQQLDAIFQQSNDKFSSSRHLLNHHGSIMLNTLGELTNLDYENYRPSNSVIYPDSDFGQQLRQTAHLIKSNIGLEIITTNSKGWDDHANQGGYEGSQANRHADFANGIAALYEDLGPSKMNDVVILTMTEFGRTAKQNASGGTDHGNASSWFVIGGNVNGGIHGSWPGLQPDDLYLGRYLDYSIDYRNIIAEIISKHLGNYNGLPSVLPGHQYQPINII